MKTSRLALAALSLCLAAAPLPAADDIKMGGMDPMTESLRPLKGKEFEAAFLQQMIHHHQDGVDMATLATTNAQSSAVKKLAEGIITKQKGEITQMTGWLKQWHGKEPMMASNMAGMKDMKGGDAMMKMEAMMKDQMSKLRAAKGAEFDRMFLSMMTEHHQGALEMAKLAVERAEHPELKKLAADIIKDQEKEISEMKTLMKG